MLKAKQKKIKILNFVPSIVIGLSNWQLSKRQTCHNINHRTMTFGRVTYEIGMGVPTIILNGIEIKVN
jgi:hypothetical protein